MTAHFITGDCLTTLKLAPAESVHCCVTSPPYFGLRDYGVPGQLGLEPTPSEYVTALVDVFREVRRVLHNHGTLWLNLGDSYARSPAKGGSGPNGKNEDRWGYGAAKSRIKDPASKQARNRASDLDGLPYTSDHPGSRAGMGGLDAKQLLGIPWRVAFALQEDGWYLRQDIIWHKPNPMPESVTDRCTKAHEYLFLLSKSDRYYFDGAAIKEPATGRDPGNKEHKYTAQYDVDDNEMHRTKAGLLGVGAKDFRNKRSVWTVAPKPFKEAHFATFPPALIEPCILAGTPAGGTVLDPFGGAGTTALVAEQHSRNSISLELNPEYVAMAQRRLLSASASSRRP